MTIAYCYASGEIDFGEYCPKGALPIASGPETNLRDFMCGVSRHTYDGHTLLVPGIPEAKSQEDGYIALSRFMAWIKEHEKDGVEVLGSARQRKAAMRNAMRKH